MKKIILASKSPRRAELLARMGYDFDVVESGVDEGQIAASSPAELVRLLAIAKAEGVHALCESAGGTEQIIIAADTVVEFYGRALGKPVDADDAKKMLTSLSGAEHFVHTGLCVLHSGERVYAGTSFAKVRFRRLGEAELDAYIASGEPMDKAGAYGIQERGAVFAEHIEGDFYAIVGLPVCALEVALRELGETPAH